MLAGKAYTHIERTLSRSAMSHALCARFAEVFLEVFMVVNWWKL